MTFFFSWLSEIADAAAMMGTGGVNAKPNEKEKASVGIEDISYIERRASNWSERKYPVKAFLASLIIVKKTKQTHNVQSALWSCGQQCRCLFGHWRRAVRIQRELFERNASLLQFACQWFFFTWKHNEQRSTRCCITTKYELSGDDNKNTPPCSASHAMNIHCRIFWRIELYNPIHGWKVKSSSRYIRGEQTGSLLARKIAENHGSLHLFNLKVHHKAINYQWIPFHAMPW